MNFLLQSISVNGCAAVLLITLLLNYRHKYGTNGREARLFMHMIRSNLLQCVVEPITGVLDGKLFPGAVTVSTVLDVFLFINTICFAVLWALYAEAKIHSPKSKKRIWGMLKYLPALLIVMGSLANLFTPVFFRITEENVYQRVGLYPVSYLATYFYLSWGTITIFLRRGIKERFVFLPALTFLFPVFLASVIQYLVPGISLLWSGAAIGLASAYMNLLDESAFTDQLSGLFSRHYLNQYLSTLPDRAKDSTLILGIMMDVDNFKTINDTFGHLTGDDAIAAVGKILRAAIPDNRFLFRYAGDEFVVIMPILELSEVEPVLARICAETERFNQNGGRPYHLRLSVGYTTYVPGEHPNAFVDRMDAGMYQDKRLHKI